MKDQHAWRAPLVLVCMVCHGWSRREVCSCLSRRLRRPAGVEQLAQVGDCADQFPLAANVVQTAQAEAPEASLFLDLSEDRFNDGLAHLVHRPARLGA